MLVSKVDESVDKGSESFGKDEADVIGSCLFIYFNQSREIEEILSDTDETVLINVAIAHGLRHFDFDRWVQLLQLADCCLCSGLGAYVALLEEEVG